MCCINLQAQTEEDYRDLLEKYIENTEGLADYTDLYDQIDVLAKHPININKADAITLARLPLMTPEKISTLLAHRLRYGTFQSVYELQQLEGFDLAFIKMLLPFISIDEVINLKTISNPLFWKGGKHELISLSTYKFEQAKGYALPDTNPNAYLGSAVREVVRYRGDINSRVQINFTAEKDAGEQLNAKAIFVSANLFFKNMGKIKSLAIGDYQAAFGQGLTFGSSMAFGKSPFVLNIMRVQEGLKSYRSLNENEFLRGIGIAYQLARKTELTCFYSDKKIDGTAQQDSLAMNDGFTSFISTGYHRNVNELNSKSVIGRRIFGAHLTQQYKNLNLGLTGVQTFLSAALIKGDKPYQLYNFNGTSITNFGIDYKWYYKNLAAFGEISGNQNFKNTSFINGLILSLGKQLDLSLLQRHYDKRYHGTMTNAIGEASNNKNENGLYAGFSLAPIRGYKLNAYADVYRFNWLRYQVDAPSGGKDFLLELQYAKRKSYSWYLRYRNEVKQMNEEGVQHLNRMENNTRQQVRFHIETIISPTLTLRNRVEWVQYQLQYGKTTHGFLMLQDVVMAPTKNLKIIGRLMYFDAQDYDARVYAYENDMLYSYSVPSFQNRGTRFYILIKYKLKRNIDIWTRFSRTAYENQTTIGSGYDLINGNKVSELKVQIKWTI
jgi:hypothetical protein